MTNKESTIHDLYTRNDRRGVPLLAETTPISALGAYSGDLVYDFAGIEIQNKDAAILRLGLASDRHIPFAHPAQ